MAKKNKTKPKNAPEPDQKQPERVELPCHPKMQAEGLYILAYKHQINGKVFGYQWRNGLLHGGRPIDPDTIMRIRGSGGQFYWWDAAVVREASGQITWEEPGLGPKIFAG